MKSIIPWSYSSWQDYQTCPRKFYETRYAKNITEEKSQAIIWGETVHTALEFRAKENRPLPDSMKHMAPVAERIISAPGDNYAEVELACDKLLRPTGFWDQATWVRGKGDLVKIKGNNAAAFDWKTGKRKENSLQLDLMAVLVFAKFPEVVNLSTCFVWFQEPLKPTIAKYIRDDAPKLINQFQDGLDNMLWSERSNTWPERPSGLCKPNPRTGYKGCPVHTCKFNAYYRGER